MLLNNVISLSMKREKNCNMQTLFLNNDYHSINYQIAFNETSN